MVFQLEDGAGIDNKGDANFVREEMKEAGKRRVPKSTDLKVRDLLRLATDGKAALLQRCMALQGVRYLVPQHCVPL